MMDYIRGAIFKELIILSCLAGGIITGIIYAVKWLILLCAVKYFL